MDSIIKIVMNDKVEVALPIEKINSLKIENFIDNIDTDKTCCVQFTVGTYNYHKWFYYDKDAKEFYDDCLARIEAYYKAMMPPRLSKGIFD